MNGHSVHAPARTVFRVLGPLEVGDPAGRQVHLSGKPAALLTTLLLHRNAWVRTERLVEIVWSGKEVPPSAQRNLKTYVWQLRRVLPAWSDGLRIESRSGAYRIRLSAGELDADLAAALAAEARTLLTEGDAAAAVDRIQKALWLWRGCPYDGLVGAAADQLVELHRSLREDLADAHLAQGQAPEAINVLHALTEEDPLRELSWTKLMSALHRTGRRHDALAAYQRARTALVRELGVEPGPQLTALHQEILCGSVEVVEREVRNDLPRQLPGFVGRGNELAAVVTAARTSPGTPVVAVDGMPGIGKTALALEAAHALAPSYPDGQLYLDLRTQTAAPLSPIDALSNLIRAVRGADVVLPASAEELAGLWRSTINGRSILLLLDDVARADLVRPLLPGAAGSLVLLTGRGRLAGPDCSASVTLDVLPDPEAHRLAGPGVGEVLQWYGGHPAAIRLLADRLQARPPWTVARMVSRLTDPVRRHRELGPVLARFDSSYRALPPLVQRVYRLLGLMPHFDLRRAARLVGVPPDELEPTVDLLLDLHLVTEPTPGRFAMHPLVRDHAYSTLLATESKAELAELGHAVDRGRPGLELVSPNDPRVA